MTVVDDALELQDDLVALRRDLHREPELGLDLPKTQEKVLAALDGLPLEITPGRGLTSVTAVLRGEQREGQGGSGERRTVLLRGDMDALPVTESSGVPYAAAGPTMHACGHDLHTAMLVGAARILAAGRDRLPGDVVFMFQPGEEGDDGAQHMIDEGVLEAAGRQADAAYAVHVTSAMLPAGVFASRPATLMASADSFLVTVHGAGGHGSAPHRARDPIPAACEMVLALQTMVTRTFDVFDPVVITVGTFHAGKVDNVIPGSASFEATVRSFSPEAHEHVLDAARRVCEGIAAAHGLDVELGTDQSYPVTVNTPAHVERIGSVVADLYGPNRYLELPSPVTGAEDFSRVLERVPGAMVFLGATPADRDPASAPFNHAPEAAFDDGVLAEGTALYAELARRALRD